MQRLTIAMLATALILSACGGSEPEAAPTTATPSSEAAVTSVSRPPETLRQTTTSSTTTTTTKPPAPPPQLSIEGAGPLLLALMRDLYTAPAPVLPSEEGKAKAPPVTTGDQQNQGKANKKKAPSHPRPKVPTTNENLAELLGMRTLVTNPMKGRAEVATLESGVIAVVQVGRDITLAVKDPDWKIVGGWWPSFDMKGARVGKFPKLVAVIGSDARPDDDPATALADSIHIIGLDGTGAGGSLGIPRDSWESLSTGGTSKINAALARGGPDAMMETLENTTGLDLDGYLLTGFSGFEAMVDILGGVQITLDEPMVDSGSHADFDAGKHLMDGVMALAFSRTRKTLFTGDFERQVNGGVVLKAATAVVRELGVMSIPSLIKKSEEHFLTDLSAEELLLFSVSAYLSDLDKIGNDVADGTTGSAGGPSVVFLLPSADDQFADMADGVLDD
ncbi:MAG: hypothetical protein GEU79_17185 [Acidimicrobiia bacterium]|nr:hypothetical protein [Acidimicrobiia bacterium]